MRNVEYDKEIGNDILVAANFISLAKTLRERERDGEHASRLSIDFASR